MEVFEEELPWHMVAGWHSGAVELDTKEGESSRAAQAKKAK